jgi:hypothetical protein
MLTGFGLRCPPRARSGVYDSDLDDRRRTIVSEATQRDDLLALYEANRATKERLVALTTFDVDWYSAADELSGNDRFDIHAIDDAFDELNLTVN